jgi:SAM-dependent methyltransferase
MELSGHKRNWEDLAKMDAYWAILTDPEARYGKWDVDEFFRTGQQEIARVMDDAGRMGYPRQRGSALDFGCGVGRLTRAFATYFQECYGVDISDSMIAQAKVLNEAYPTCHFVSNARSDLHVFPDERFDMVFSLIVLQHIPSQEVIRSYIAEFVRVLRPGGLLVFQLPCYIAPKDMRQARSKLYAALRTMGVSQRFLYERVGLHPIRMNFIPEADVIAHLQACGANVLEARDDTLALPALSKTYYVTK